MNLQKVHLNPSTRILKFIGNLLMIRPIERKLLTKTVISLLVCFCCFSWTLNRSFLSVNAATISNHQTFTGGRVDWEINTYSTVQDINVDGTTFRAAGIIILNYYLTNTSTGTIRLYWTGFNSGWYNAMNIYSYGATISNVAYSGSAGITFKINNPTDRITVVITFNSTDMNTSLEGITTFSNVSSLTTVTSSESTVQDIDLKLADIDSTLSDILSILGSGQTSIVDYLDSYITYFNYLTSINSSLTDLIILNNLKYNRYNLHVNSINHLYQNYDYNLTNINSSFYYVAYSNKISVGDIELDIYDFPVNGNYFVLSFMVRTSDSISFDKTNIRVFIRDANNSFVRMYNAKIYYSHSARNGINTEMISVYIPIYEMVYRNSYDYNAVSISGITYTNVDRIGYFVRGVVETLPEATDVLSDDSVITNLNDKVDELNDVTQQTQTIENQQIDNLESFNQSIDLDDYDFDFTNRNGIEYFKLKLTNIYDIEEFKPFYLIPIMLFILGVILRG